jgi:hypothetical protein
MVRVLLIVLLLSLAVGHTVSCESKKVELPTQTYAAPKEKPQAVGGAGEERAVAPK